MTIIMDTSGAWPIADVPHEWPRSSVQDDVDYVLHGRLNDLPPPRRKVVRIFLSSTFTDMTVERNTLIKRVYPNLRKICRVKYGLEFQVVDMRWGVRDEAFDDHSGSDLCMRELRICQEVSLGPTFVNLLGQRYGSRPLPSVISEDHMDALVTSFNNNRHLFDEEEANLLWKWYKKDENAVTPQYILQPISAMAERENRPDSYQMWSKVSRTLQAVVRRCAMLAVENGLMTSEMARTFHRSVTEEEIDRGLIQDSNPNAHCLCFTRTLHDINLMHNKAWRFIDQTDQKAIDEESQLLLEETKDRILSYLDHSNLFHFDVPWSDDGGVSELDHSQYLSDFCNTFQEAVMKLIERGVQSEQGASSDALYNEVLEHAHQCVAKCEQFHGRDDILSSVRHYLTSATNKPLVVHGGSGCGKTSILAMAAREVIQCMGDSKDLVVMLRFLGTTPDSSTVRTTLRSLCKQLIRTNNLHMEEEDLPIDFKSLRDTFLDLIKKLPENRHALIILDSLDQLSPSDNALDLTWLPKDLPTNVKFIVSTLSDEFGLVEKIKLLGLPEDHFAEVKTLDSSVSHEIVDNWLRRKGRKLTKQQREVLNKALAQEVTPLYLKVIFDQISSWKSYELDLPQIPNTVRSCLEQLYQNIEKKHGRILVARALGYLALAKNGLTEVELEDLLSLDDTVLSDVFEFHVPPVRRLPSILWARIRHDLEEYIVEREADAAKVIAWYHRQFKEASNERYHPCTEKAQAHACGYPIVNEKGDERRMNFPDRGEIIRIFYEYFFGTWAGGMEKPFHYTEGQQKKLGLTNPEASADRHVSEQPVVFSPDNRCMDVTNIRFNLRKFSQLPHILMTAENGRVNIGQGRPVASECQISPTMITVLKDLIFNLEFVTGWIATTPWDDIVKVINLIMNDYSVITMKGEGATLQNELSLWKQTLLLSYTTLYRNPAMCGSAFAGRMLMYWGHLGWNQDMLSQADKEGLRLCALAAPHHQLETPGGELAYIINNHVGPVNDASWGDDADDSCYHISLSRKVVIVDWRELSVIVDTRPRGMPHQDVFYRMLFHGDCVWVSTQPSPILYCFEKKTGEVLHVIDLRDHGACSDYNITSLEKVEWKFPVESFLLTWSKGGTKVFSVDLTSVRVTSFSLDMKADLVLTLGEDVIVITEPTVHQIGRVDAFLLHSSSDHSRMGIKRIFGARLPPYGKVTAHAVIPGTRSFFLAFERGDILHVAPWEMSWIVRMGMPTIKPSKTRKDYYIYDHMREYTRHIYEIRRDTENSVSVKNSESRPVTQTSTDYSSDIERNSSEGDDTGLDMASVLLLDGPTYAFKLDEPVTSISVANEEDLRSVVTICLESSMKCYTVENTRIAEQPVLEVRKTHYKEAVISQDWQYLMCHGHGSGQLDIYRFDTSRRQVAPLKSLDAHTEEITTVLTTEDDFLFSTASEDGSVKFWITNKLELHKNTMLTLSRTTNVIEFIHSLDLGDYIQMAFTRDGRNGNIDAWDVISGRILCHVLQSDDLLSHCVAWREEPEGKRGYLLAVFGDSTLRVWDVRQFVPTTGEDRDAVADRNTCICLKLPFDVIVPAQPRVLLFKCLPRYPDTVVLVLSSGTVATIQVNRKGDPQIKYHKLNEQLGHTAITDGGTLTMISQASPDTRGLYQLNVYPDIVSTTVTRVPTQVSHTVNGIRAAGERIVIFGDDQAMSWTEDPTSANSVPCEDLLDIQMSGDGKVMILQQESCIQVPDPSTMVSILKHTPPAKPSFLKISPDGEYFVYVYGGKEIRLVRIRDGLVIAWYTMVSNIHSFEVSSNGWFVLAGTSDRRLFVLAVADIENPSTKTRLELLREYNAPVDTSRINLLVSQAAKLADPYDSSDDMDSDVVFGSLDSESDSEMLVTSDACDSEMPVTSDACVKSERMGSNCASSKGRRESHHVMDMTNRRLSRSWTPEIAEWKIKTLLQKTDSDNISGEPKSCNLDANVDGSISMETHDILMTPRICSLQ